MWSLNYIISSPQLYEKTSTHIVQKNKQMLRKSNLPSITGLLGDKLGVRHKFI